MKKVYYAILITFISINVTQPQENNVNHPLRFKSTQDYFAAMDSFYNDSFFSKGKSPDQMDGTGYYPYLRRRHFYENRVDENQRLLGQDRWNIYKESRLRLLQRDAHVSIADWELIGSEIGTWAGRMISLCFDPNNQNTIFAGAAEGGLWKTTDLGNNWQCITDDIPAVGVSAIAVNKQNSNEMLIGTGEGKLSAVTFRPGIGVLKSLDGGLTWQQTNFDFNSTSNISVFNIVWDPQNSDNVYLTATNGLWVSRDAGINWTQKSATRATALVINKTNPSNLFAFFENNGSNSGVFRSSDFGETWTQLSNGIPTDAGLGYSTISIHDANPNIIYASLSRWVTAQNVNLDGIYKSTDGGESWATINTPPVDYTCQPGSTTSCQGWYVNQITVSPTNPDIILAGGVTFWRSNNGGISWTPHDVQSATPVKNTTYADQQAILFSPFDSNIVVDASDGGIAVSNNAGLTWTHKNNNLITSQFYNMDSSILDPEFIIGGMQDHGLLAHDFSNNNLVATKWLLGGDGHDVSINHENDNIIYGTTLTGRIFKNSNRGLNQGQTSFAEGGLAGTSIPFFATIEMDHINPDVLFHCTPNKIFKTIDGAQNWIEKATITNSNGYKFAIDKNNNNYVYLATWHSPNGTFGLYRSEDGGESWNLSPGNPSWRVLDLEADPNIEGTLYAVRNSAIPNNDHVLKSTDYGNSWEDITGDLPDIPTNAIAINPFDNSRLYVATDFGVYTTENGGENWHEFNDGMPLTYSLDLNYHVADSTLRVATHGRGAWRTKTENSLSIPEVNQSLSSIKISPNPTSGPFDIEINLKTNNAVKVKLYNIHCQFIKDLLNKTVPGGLQKIELNNNNKQLSSGIYFLKIILGNQAVTKKLVIK